MNSKATRSALMASIVSLVLCFTMLMGSTFAWFVDRVHSSGNRIEAGNLAVDLLMYNSTTGNYVSIAGTDANVFSLSEGNSALWYPGVTKTIYFAVRNTGSLPVKYNASLTVGGDLVGALWFSISNDVGAGALAISESDGTLGFDELTAGEIPITTESRMLKSADKNSRSTETVGETHYYALTVKMYDRASAEDYANTTATINIVVNATQANVSEDGTYSDVSAISEIPEEEKVTSLASTSWKFNETVNDLELFAEPEPETEETKYIFPAKSTISDGENEYELSGFELAERENAKLLTTVKAEEIASEDANAESTADTGETVETENIGDADEKELVFVYYEETEAESEENEAAIVSDESANVNGWYLLELESVKAALEDEGADFAELIKDKTPITDAEKLPIITFADDDEDKTTIKNKALIDWMYQNATIQEKAE